MKTLKELHDQRNLNLYKLLPDDIGRKELPPFFIPVIPPNIEFPKKKPKLENLTEIRSSMASKMGKAMKKLQLINYNPNPKLKPRKTIEAKSSSKKRITNLRENLDNFKFSIQKSDANNNGTDDILIRAKEGKSIKFLKGSLWNNALYDNGCITCGKDNISVKYYGERHMCITCREMLKTIYFHKANVFLNEFGGIEIVGSYYDQDRNKKVYYSVNHDEIRFGKYNCIATFAGEDELVIIFNDKQDSNIKMSETLNTHSSVA